jgi:ATP-dependent Clp protease adaptor protein ClpS
MRGFWLKRRPTYAGRTRAAAPVLPDLDEELDAETRVRDAFAKGWGVIVWNDPVNLMSYVVFVFKRVLKMSDQAAQKHMREVHEQGKSLVAQETREKAEFYVHQIQSFGLQATLEAL